MSICISCDVGSHPDRPHGHMARQYNAEGFRDSPDEWEECVCRCTCEYAEVGT